MKKLLFFLIYFTATIMSTEIQYIEGDICVSDYYNEDGKCKVIYTLDGSEHFLKKRCNRYHFIDNNCTDNSRLVLSKSEYNLLMGITSNLLGFMLVFLVGFLFVLQGRR